MRRAFLLSVLYKLMFSIAEEKETEVPDVDDTDGIDPEGEFEAWRLRELARIKRERHRALKVPSA